MVGDPAPLVRIHLHYFDIDNEYNNGYAATIQPDGKILVTGEKIGGGEMAVTLVRYNSDGSLDTTFDSNGIVITNIGNGSDEGHSVVVQQDGKLIVAGISNNGVHDDIALLRYNSNGSLDDTFDTDGIVVTDFNGNLSAASSVVIDNDNKILIAGATYNGTDLDFALARYNSGVLEANDFTNKKDYFNVFPNPTTGLLTIHSDKAISQLEIYYLLGQLSFSFNDTNTIDISSVDQGVYFVKVMDEKGNVGTKKVVKK